MTIITWLHISDLHFGSNRNQSGGRLAPDAEVVLAPLHQDIRNLTQQQDLRLDFIAVTGDIAFSGKPAQYAQAGNFFDVLLRTVDLPKNRLFLVPGNHDVDREQVRSTHVAIEESLTSQERTNKILDTDDDRKFMMTRFEGYAAFVNDYLEGVRSFDHENYFYVHNLDLDGVQVALLGLNSAWLCSSDKDEENRLLVGERQTRKALEKAEKADLKVALLHHPFELLRPFERNVSKALLIERCDFILHGHLHESEFAELHGPGTGTGAMVVGAGACYESQGYSNAYNVIQLNLKTGRGKCFLRKWSPNAGGFWTTDTTTYRAAKNGQWSFKLPRRLLISDPGSVTKKGPELQFAHVSRPKLFDPVRESVAVIPSKRFVEYRGIPGIGKSPLLNDLARELQETPDVTVARVDLSDVCGPNDGKSWPSLGRHILALLNIAQKWETANWFEQLKRTTKKELHNIRVNLENWMSLSPAEEAGVRECIKQTQGSFCKILAEVPEDLRIVLIFDQVDATEELYRDIWKPLEDFLLQEVLYRGGTSPKWHASCIVIVGRRSYREGNKSGLEKYLGYTDMPVPLFTADQTQHQLESYLPRHDVIPAIHALSAGHPKANEEIAKEWRKGHVTGSESGVLGDYSPRLITVVDREVITRCLDRFSEDRRKYPATDHLLALFRLLDKKILQEFWNLSRISGKMPEDAVSQGNLLYRLAGSCIADCQPTEIRIDQQWRRVAEGYWKHRSLDWLLQGHELAVSTFDGLIHTAKPHFDTPKYYTEKCYHLWCHRRIQGRDRSLEDILEELLQDLKHIVNQFAEGDPDLAQVKLVEPLRCDEEIRSQVADDKAYEVMLETMIRTIREMKP